MANILFKAGNTFSYVGTVANLDPSIAWQASASIRAQQSNASVDVLTCTLVQADDFTTSHIWNLTLYQTAAKTALWSSIASKGVLIFDIKFYNSAASDPVIRSESLTIQLQAAVTP